MKKGDSSTNALVALVIMVAVVAIAILIVSSLSGDEADVFKKYIDIPVG